VKLKYEFLKKKFIAFKSEKDKPKESFEPNPIVSIDDYDQTLNNFFNMSKNSSLDALSEGYDGGLSSNLSLAKS